jgi:hypothetical protein
VVSDRHSRSQLAPYQGAVAVGEVADREEGGVNVQPLEGAEDAGGVLRRGAVVEGERDRAHDARRAAVREEPRRDEPVRDGAADDDLSAGGAGEEELRVRREPLRHRHHFPGERLTPVATGDERDPVAVAQPGPGGSEMSVQQERARNGASPEHLPPDVEQVARARLQPELRRRPPERGAATDLQHLPHRGHRQPPVPSRRDQDGKRGQDACREHAGCERSP